MNDGAGFVLGVLAWALVLNYLHGGAGQVRGWMAAKWLNRPYSGPGAERPARPARPDPGGISGGITGGARRGGS